jgi:hypothetical protein
VHAIPVEYPPLPLTDPVLLLEVAPAALEYGEDVLQYNIIVRHHVSDDGYPVLARYKDGRLALYDLPHGGLVHARPVSPPLRTIDHLLTEDYLVARPLRWTSVLKIYVLIYSLYCHGRILKLLVRVGDRPPERIDPVLHDTVLYVNLPHVELILHAADKDLVTPHERLVVVHVKRT